MKKIMIQEDLRIEDPYVVYVPAFFIVWGSRNAVEDEFDAHASSLEARHCAKQQRMREAKPLVNVSARICPALIHVPIEWMISRDEDRSYYNTSTILRQI